MYEKTLKPLRELARNEPLKERSRQMFTVPTEIPKAVVDGLSAACQDFLTQAVNPAPPTPAPATLYTLSDNEYILNGHVADLLIEQKNGILDCLNVPNGIRMIRVLSVDSIKDEAKLEVHFFNINYLEEIVSTYNADNASAKQMFSISGGARIRAGNALGQIQVDSSNAPVNPAIEMPDADQPILNLIIKPIGDYSTYTLEIHSSSITSPDNPVFDPLFAEISFKFRPGCFNTNCAPEWEISPPPLIEPTIDYLAKDYESFRLTMIAAMMERVPGWEATSEADLDMVLAELFSVSADELSDYQDRVMNEAFFASSRKRVSMARHARLMDYHIHQGNQASAWLALEIDHKAGNQSFELEEGLLSWAGNFKLDGTKKEPDDSSVIFNLGYETKQTIHQLLNSIGLYTWSDSIPVLKSGSTKADLKLYNRLYLGDSASPQEDSTEDSAKEVQDLIQTGQIKYLLIQEHLNPTTGKFAGRNRSKRQLLRLLEGIEGATAMYDPIEDEWFVRVRWEKEDALRHDYCFTVDCPAPIGQVENISLFHGNLAEVFQGNSQVTIFKEKSENLLIDPNFPLEFYFERTRWGAICRLPDKYLAYRKTAAGGDIPPFSTLKVSVGEPGGGINDWDEVPNLIHSDDSDENGDHFVVETDENRQSFIRFGNGRNGKELSKKATVFCHYQVGEPLEGNIGADKLIHFEEDSIISNPNGLQIRSCWNPFDVTDGKDIEPAIEIIRRVPEAFQTRQLRAVTLADYETRAEGIPGVSKAAAKYAWTGSWRTVRLTIDPIGTNEVSEKLRREIADYIDAVRLIGEDFEIRPPKFVPLEIVVSLCIEPDFWIEDVKFVLEQEFSTGWTPDGRKGFFHPDLWTFGQTIHESQIIGRAIKIQGVEHIISVSIKRWNAPTPGTKSSTSLNHNEIIEVLSDPDHQERGFIKFETKGGRQ